MAMKRMWSKGQVKNLSKEVIESGLVENAKPIYYHPIYLEDAGNTFRIQFVILDNNSVAYTKDTCLAKVKELLDTGALINCNGFYRSTNVDDCANVYLMSKAGANYRINFFVGSTISATNIDGIFSSISFFYDGVNKIN